MVLQSFSNPRAALLFSPIVLCLVLVGGPKAHGKEVSAAPAGVEPKPVSVTLDDSDHIKRLGSGDAKGGAPTNNGGTSGWTTILSENSEGDFPTDNGWNVSDANSNSGEDYWDDVDCRFATGAWSIWCADIGDQTNCSEYDNNMDSKMVFGPFSLADAQDAKLEFSAWSEVEDDFDGLSYMASIDGTTFHGFEVLSDFDWTDYRFDLKRVPNIGDLRGQSQVWIAFRFKSDGGIAVDEGVYLDDILLEKLVGSSGCTANGTTLCLPANDRFRLSLAFSTTQGGGQSGDAQAVSLDSQGIAQGGIFHFGNAANPEVLVKVLNGCAVNNHFWVFYAATTNVGFDLTVTDTSNGTSKVYRNPDRTPAATVTDTQAFATCP